MKKINLKYLSLSLLLCALLVLFYKTSIDKIVFPFKNTYNQDINNGDITLKGKTIVIDPGHGDFDSGTVGLTYGTIEKTLNLTVANNLKKALEQQTEATILLTREGDTNPGNNQKDSLQKRIDIAEGASADLFISIHHDAFTDTDVKGITTHYSSHTFPNKQLAKIIQTSLFNQKIETRDRGTKASDYYVLKHNSVPAILVELGFTSNKEDELRMNSSDFQSKSAQAIAEGIISFLAV